VDFTFFASGEQFTRDHWKLALDAGTAVIDLSYALENEPGIPVSAPLIERELGQRAQLNLDAHTVAIAHPAAITLALLLLRGSRAAQISAATATIFEPVSEQGRRGMDELHEQTVNLLSFQQLPKGVFDSQVAFNMIGRFGPESGTTLESIERRIEAHLRKLTAGRVLDPAITLVQAPVFHAHTFSIYLEFAKPVSDGDLSSALAGEQVALARAPEEAPSNVNVAGKNEILVSLRRDIARSNGFWLWVAVDNLRLAALTAVDCAAALATVRPHGKVQ
jgi:aspartate-semialdehyde dehydrogenase